MWFLVLEFLPYEIHFISIAFKAKARDRWRIRPEYMFILVGCEFSSKFHTNTQPFLPLPARPWKTLEAYPLIKAAEGSSSWPADTFFTWVFVFPALFRPPPPLLKLMLHKWFLMRSRLMGRRITSRKPYGNGRWGCRRGKEALEVAVKPRCDAYCPVWSPPTTKHPQAAPLRREAKNWLALSEPPAIIWRGRGFMPQD